MNKSALRNFAVWARRDLIKRISDRAGLLGVYENKPTKEIQATTGTGFVVNGVTFNYKKEMREAFVNRVKEIGYQDAIEEIAYTWFNRIVALRFMEVNGYLKNGKNGEKIYIIGSQTTGKNEPDALTNADKLLFVDKFKVYDFQDANDNNGLYRYILTTQCNNLNEVMPLMFQKIDDYAELLLPDHLLDKGAIIDHLVNDISAKDFNITIKDDDGENASQVEIVGWLYQFYISEKKEDVFAGLKNNTKISKGTLPAATQIFTPDWIVRYMTDNTLGKMWVESRKSNLKNDLKYYLEPAEQDDEVKEKLNQINKEYATKNVKDITFIDPCCGSGHILVYVFDMFYKMYLESGYLGSEIPSLILQNNLYGIDVDKRAAQLTSFALTMKALSYDKDFLSKHIYPNVIDIRESNAVNLNELNEFINVTKLSSEDEEICKYLIEKFKDAELYGSLLKDFQYSVEKLDVLSKALQGIDETNYFNLYDRLIITNIKPLLNELIKEAIILVDKYDIVVTNPPYAGNSKLPNLLTEYLKNEFPDSKSDLFSAFIQRVNLFSKMFVGLMTPNSWMFLSSYEKLREYIIDKKTITSMVQLANSGFAEAVVFITTFTMLNINLKNYNGDFIRLEKFNNPLLQEPKTIEAIKNKKCDYRYVSNSNKYINIPGKPIAYWISEKVMQSFIDYKTIGEIAPPKQGLATANNDLFLRFWNEIDIKDIGFNCSSCEDSKLSNKRYFPYNKGGNYRRWYGNRDYVVNWENDGFLIRNFKDELGKVRSRPQNTQYYFQPSITWSDVTSASFSGRFCENGFMFDIKGSSGFPNKDIIHYVLAFLNSQISQEYIKILNPTVTTQVGDMSRIPIIVDKNYKNIIDELALQNIELSKLDWDKNETSWDFKKQALFPELIVKDLDTNEKFYSLKVGFDSYKEKINQRFEQLKLNEEKLNEIFIEIYGLQDELKPNVMEKDVTITKIFDRKEDIPEEMKNNIYVKTKQDVIKDLISYIIGCAFGRYSPYKEGLIFAGGKFDFNSYIDFAYKKGQDIKEFYADIHFEPSNENCIMITDNDYGKNEMIEYVVEFISNVYGNEYLEENLRFIANSLDEKSNDTPRNTIRKYIANDFFKDHCKKYQNRPIYWQFDSGKNGGFKALMYLHRYDENTIPTARLSYLHDIQWKYEQEKDRLEKFVENSSIASEKAKAKKELDLIDKQILECKAYDEILNHAANMRIELDLDDGVRVNYQKLQKLDGDKDKNILSTYLKFKDKE